MLRPTGILSLNSTFRAQGVCPTQDCNDPADFDRITFFNLRHGIQAGNSNDASSTFSVYASDFNSNHTGISARVVPNLHISDCLFNVGSDSYGVATENHPYQGISLDHCTGFEVTRNNLTGLAASSDVPNYVGIVVADAGPNENEIRGNILSNLHCATLSNGNNRAAFMPNVGLAYYCNVYQNNFFDIAVPEENIADSGVRGIFGTPNEASGNIFTNYSMNAPGRDAHFLNKSFGNVDYYYLETAPLELPEYVTFDPDTGLGVKVDDTPNAAECTEEADGGGCFPYPCLPIDLINCFSQYDSEWQTTKQLYESLIDGGDTDQLVTTIQNTSSQQAATLQGKLEQFSPYLSEKALEELTLRIGDFPEQMIYKVLSENPDVLRRGKLLSYITTLDNTLSDGTITALQQEASTITIRGNQEAEMALLYAKRTKCINRLIRYYVTMEDDLLLEELISWFTERGDLSAEYDIARLWIRNGSASKAKTTISEIPTKYELSDAYLADWTAYSDWFELMSDMIDGGNSKLKKVYDENEQNIGTTANIGIGRANVEANVLTCFFKGEGCEIPIILPQLANTMGLVVPPSNGVNEDFTTFIAIPNPATDLVTFRLPTTQIADENRAIYVYSVDGNLIKHLAVPNAVTEMSWETKDLPKGVYFAILEINNVRSAELKLIISR